jgi:hypothetical protein
VGRDPAFTPLWATNEFILQCCMVTRGRETKHHTLLNSVLTTSNWQEQRLVLRVNVRVALEGMFREQSVQQRSRKHYVTLISVLKRSETDWKT